MKKYLYYAIIALMAISCSESEDPVNEIVPDTPSKAPESIEAEIPRVESRAVWKPEFESWEGTESIHSRTYAVLDQENTNEYYQYWHAGDAISLFTTTQNMQYVLVSGASSDVAKFELNSSDATLGNTLTTGYYYSVYPYKETTTITTDGQVTYTFPKTQKYNKNSYAKDYNGLIAKKDALATDNIYEFKNFCSYLQLRLKSNHSDKDVEKIILHANNTHDFLSGIGTITYEGNEPVVTMDHENSINAVFLDCTNDTIHLNPETATEFWFVLPGNFKFSQGFNVTVVFSDGTYFVQNTNKEITIKRNHITPMAPFTITELLTSTIKYKFKNQRFEGDTPIPYSFPNDSFKDEQGNILTFKQTYVNGEWWITFPGDNLYSIETNTFLIAGNDWDLEYVKISNSEPITLQHHAFYWCSAETIEINNDIENLGEHSFCYSNLENLTINGNVNVIDTDAFIFTKKLKNIHIEGRVDKISQDAFVGSTIEKFEVTDRILNIEENAFKLTPIKYVNLSGVEHIGDNAFLGCDNLTEVNLSSVHKIGNSAFAGCSSLSYVNISENCVEIGEGAFVDCFNLTTIDIRATTPPTLIHSHNDYEDPYVFPRNDMPFKLNTTINVPSGSLSSYESNLNGWWWYSEESHQQNKNVWIRSKLNAKDF